MPALGPGRSKTPPVLNDTIVWVVVTKHPWIEDIRGRKTADAHGPIIVMVTWRSRRQKNLRLSTWHPGLTSGRNVLVKSRAHTQYRA